MQLTLDALRQANGTFRAGNILIEDDAVKAVAITSFGNPMKIGDTIDSKNFNWRVFDKDQDQELEIAVPQFQAVVRNVFQAKRLTPKGQATYINYLRIL